MSTTLKTGDQAPPFKAQNQKGETVSLDNFKGKKVVLYFYPKDDTPGCTKEACNLRDHHKELLNTGYEVVGVSVDDVDSHQKFAEKYDLPFNLLADPDKQIVSDYGVYGEKNSFGKKTMGTKRTTFVIDEDGKIEQVIKSVKTEDHASQILGA